jgi:hypothetical protein
LRSTTCIRRAARWPTLEARRLVLRAIPFDTAAKREQVIGALAAAQVINLVDERKIPFSEYRVFRILVTPDILDGFVSISQHSLARLF